MKKPDTESYLLLFLATLMPEPGAHSCFPTNRCLDLMLIYFATNFTHLYPPQIHPKKTLSLQVNSS